MHKNTSVSEFSPAWLDAIIEAPGDKAPGRILVVDDDARVRDSLRSILERQGYVVTEAENGETALAAVAAQPPDVVLMDVIMPHLDGFAACRGIKADPATAAIPVLLLTGLGQREVRLTGIDAGANDFLNKPVDLDDVVLRVRNAMFTKRLYDHLQEKERRVDQLLRVILPDEVVEELKASNEVKARRYERVAVMFCDVVGFTPFCENHEPEEIVDHLQELIVAFEEVAERHGLEKIKTIGDAFMAVAGLLTPSENPVLDCVRCGEDMLTAIGGLASGWNVRIGIHVGPVLAGILGHRKYLFDVFGDTVNTASRVESHGMPGRVNLSDIARRHAAGHCEVESSGLIRVKGKGEMEIFSVSRPCQEGGQPIA